MNHTIDIRLWSPSIAYTFELTPGTKLHGEGASPMLTEPFFEAVISASRVFPDGSKELGAQIRLDQSAWEHFRDNVSAGDFIRDCMGLSDYSLKLAVEAQVNWMTNHYEHESCESTWSDDHSCACDDECPECGTSISPDCSDVHTALTELDGRPGVYGLTGASHQARLNGPGQEAVASAASVHNSRQARRPAP